MALKLISKGFQDESIIPDKYSKHGGNISPPLTWRDVPKETKSLALIVDDPDAPSGLFVHWLLYGISSKATGLEEGASAGGALPDGARQGRNGFGDVGYGGPQPPSGTHRYFFHLYALDYDPPLAPGASREEIDRAIRGHIIEETQLMGRYQHGGSGSRAAGG